MEATDTLNEILLWRAWWKISGVLKETIAAAPQSVQSCPTLCDLMDCNPPGSCVLEIFLARILEWVAMPASRGFSQSGENPPSPSSPASAGGFFTTEPSGKPKRPLVFLSSKLESKLQNFPVEVLSFILDYDFIHSNISLVEKEITTSISENNGTCNFGSKFLLFLFE